MRFINKELLQETISRAQVSPRQRTNYNFHLQLNDPLQRMLNAIEPGSYIQPHRHQAPDKREAFIILSGKAIVVSFTGDGQVKEHITLSQAGGNVGCEIPEGEFHTIIALEKGTVVYEVKDGPYSPMNDKDFAPWAPREGEKGTLEYMQQLLDRLGAGASAS
ncbi:MAG: WbuC family cupin fold metalloprotein [Bacteroidales bacterium]|nr:WbuC family cupin fold metalloprotein [Bacteroidales bacterium]